MWLLVVLMALTFSGLLYMQLMYLDNIIKMRDDQFSEGVKRSLYAVALNLEQDETKDLIGQVNVEVNGVYTQSSEGVPPAIAGAQVEFRTHDGVNANITIKSDLVSGNDQNQVTNILTATNELAEKYNSHNEAVRGKYATHRSMIDEVILKIIGQSSRRPIEERADTATIRKYLKRELGNYGLSLPFEFAVANKNGYILYNTENYSGISDGANNKFVQHLFPNDAIDSQNYLKVYFPSKKSYVIESIKIMIPSFALTFILLIIFLFTVYLAFRQKKLSEMKNDFINNMTHEFKTPISSISLAAQMLNDDTVRKSPAMLQHISTVIMDETKRLRFQVEKVLQMSMFDRSRASLRLQDVDANLAIQNIVKTFKLKVERYGGRLSAELNAEDSIVNVDEMHFTNVIFNLLDNAVKYRKPDEPLDLNVMTRNIPGDKLEITVSDNGIGIKKENLKRIFERFYRVSTGNLHDVKGFGLGLAYVDKMVRELKGQISVESEYNQGTKFIIILPLTKN